MRVIEHRRHTMRTQPGQHLSQAGVDLARLVGRELDPFDLVVTSTIPRAFETAIAMGFAVDEQMEELAMLAEGVEAEVQWDAGFVAFAEAMDTSPDGALARYARSLAGLHRHIAERLPGGGRALIVSHGGIVEASAMGCLKNEDLTSWGPACGYCEGVRLFFDAGEFTQGECLRVAAPRS
jgi:broad specificity phosphatase PhoE